MRRFLRRLDRWKYNPGTYAEHLRRCGVSVGEGCRISAFGIEVGIEPYLLKIGNRVIIEREVACITHDGAAWVFRHLVPDIQVFGPVVIEDDCHIGAQSILCPGIRIGRKAVIVPGSLVIADVLPGAVMAGVPARQRGFVS